MENAPENNTGPSIEELHNRIAQLDQEIIELENQLNAAGSEAQESTQGDDDAIESEFTTQARGQIRMKIEDLRRLKAALQSEVDTHQKAV